MSLASSRVRDCNGNPFFKTWQVFQNLSGFKKRLECKARPRFFFRGHAKIKTSKKILLENHCAAVGLGFDGHAIAQNERTIVLNVSRRKIIDDRNF